MIDNITNIDISGALHKTRAVRPCVPGLMGLDHPDMEIDTCTPVGGGEGQAACPRDGAPVPTVGGMFVR